ncbi:MAG: hypothetical protein O3B13_21295 [Planctomycetota bacterium]|nr:hypothetical protein [Planctomycetota bacterium]MDA1165640.1 hypothetical protein [Planctomycetota bacterium]
MVEVVDQNFCDVTAGIDMDVLNPVSLADAAEIVGLDHISKRTSV